MGISDILKETITGVKVMKGPVFLKDNNSAEEQIKQLEVIYEQADEVAKEEISQDIRSLKYGLVGENAIKYELQNSHMPMVVLQDLYLEHEGLTAQIDYLIITKKGNFVIECKNLYGNITVNNAGDFIRTVSYGKRFVKEGIYSPITQNERHMELIKQLRASEKGMINKILFEKYFNENYKSIIVLANPKTVIDMKYAKKEVKDKIIRCDQLVRYMKEMNAANKSSGCTDKQMMELGEKFLSYHKENKTDYLKKYRVHINTVEEKISIMDQPSETEQKSDEIQKTTVEQRENIAQTMMEENPLKGDSNHKCKQADNNSIALEDTPLYKELKKYRLDQSRIENIKAFYIYNNLQLESIIKLMPKNEEELKSVSGFGDMKCQKYGTEIIKIVNRYREE